MLKLGKNSKDRFGLLSKTLILLIFAFSSGAFLTGCKEKGPLEKAGESADEAIDDAGDAIEDAGDKIQDETSR